MQNNNNIIISVEGNIGAGKSTALKKIAELKFNRPLYVIPEPVEEWMKHSDIYGKSIFELYCSDIKKHAYMFQNYVLNTRLRKLIEYNNKYKNSILVFERSISSDRKVFVESLSQVGNMTPMEKDVFDETYRQSTQLTNGLYDSNFIYLKTTPKVSLQRIKKRARPGEETLGIGYLRVLSNHHDTWLLNQKNTLVIDADKSYEDFEIEKVEKFIEKLI